MNNFFSLRRFSRLFIKHTIEHYRTYLMSTAVIFGVFVFGGTFIFFVFPAPPDTGMQTACFVLLMLVSGSIFTSTVFGDYGNKSKAIPAITLPASSFEKYLVGWLYSYPIFMAIYTGIFFLVLFTLGQLVHFPGIRLQIMSLSQPEMLLVLVIYSSLHSCCIFGAIFFEKLHFIKTGFAFFIGYIVITMCNTMFLKLITGVTVIKMALPFGFLNFSIGSKFYSVVTTGPVSTGILITIFLAAALIWAAAYFRLKEKQV
ncbi:hypothetical protein [Mucilaginibacter sp. SG564]|uniref:hypothetical protein n=1 Tax=unclassified Mucilaginibacter TaxID=2617802 RepID=UPI001555C9D6|nr:hypothetical protein [Mucilaginibacter sp. SG564]NOW97928.1 hypothetical protein [Mucilaginibacter sp. SG564]